MRPTPYLIITGFAFALILTVTTFARPRWCQDLGLDVWNVPSLEARIHENARLSSYLDSMDQQILQRIAYKESLIRDLVEGRSSLVRTAAVFRLINADRQEIDTVLQAMYPGASAEERLCRNVIGFVESFVDDDEDGVWIVHRLEDELRTLLETGSLRIPDLGDWSHLPAFAR